MWFSKRRQLDVKKIKKKNENKNKVLFILPVSFSSLYPEYFVADKFSYPGFIYSHVTHSFWAFLMLYLEFLCKE